MTNPSKQKGTRFETEVAEYLGVERRTLHGNKDEGDLIIPGWAVECKNEKQINLAQYMKEVEAERTNAKAMFGCAVVKRRGKGAADAYVVMPLHLFKMLAAWEPNLTATVTSASGFYGPSRGDPMG